MRWVYGLFLLFRKSHVAPAPKVSVLSSAKRPFLPGAVPPVSPSGPLWGEKGGFERDTVARSQDCKILSPLILCASFPRLPHGPPHGPPRTPAAAPGFYTGSFLNSFSLPLQ